MDLIGVCGVRAIRACMQGELRESRLEPRTYVLFRLFELGDEWKIFLKTSDYRYVLGCHFG